MSPSSRLWVKSVIDRPLSPAAILNSSAMRGVKRLIRNCVSRKQDADVGRGHQVLHIAVGARHAVQLRFQFAVDCLQLLVDRLQLLLAGLEFLGGRTVLLVDRLQFLVGGAQLLVGALVFFARGAELRLGELQLPLELLDAVRPGVLLDRAGAVDRKSQGFALEEEDDRRPGRAGIGADRLRLEIDPSHGAVEADGDRAAETRLVAPKRRGAGRPAGRTEAPRVPAP